MNSHLRLRLAAIHNQLLAAHSGGNAMSNATRGTEREAFVDLLLRGCLPHPYRFGSGEVTDARGNISGQIDLVIEHPFYPSFPLLGTSQHRLYLVEGVAMGIEIKSSEKQFAEAVESMKKFHALDPVADWSDETAAPGWRAPAVSSVGGNVYTSFPGRVGFGIVLYQGWQRPETLRERCKAAGVDVALQLNPPVFYAARYRIPYRENEPNHVVIEGIEALIAFICVVNDELQAISASESDIFRRYVEQKPAAVHAPDEG